MDDLGLLHRGMSILDVGSSNLYSAAPDEITRFLRKYGPKSIDGLEEFTGRLAAGSAYDPIRGGLNEAFAGELFEKAGMAYLSIDIADGYKTRILDLNHEPLPRELEEQFSLVLNFGTSEHVLNQYNCFKVMHDATKVGGHIYHQLPAIGFTDHGYFTYTARCFFDLARYNRYELVACWFEGPAGGNCVYDSLEACREEFPALREALEHSVATAQGRKIRALDVPDISINVVCRKVRKRPFYGALESSTSVGTIPKDVTAMYAAGGSGIATMPLKQRVARALRSYPALYRIARLVYRTATRIIAR